MIRILLTSALFSSGRIMRFRSLLVVLTLCVPALSFSGTAQSDARPLLNQLISKYEGISSIESHVHLTIELPEQSAVEQDMTIYQKENMFRLESKDQTVISDGKTIWTYTPEDNRVVLTYADAGETDSGMNFNSPHAMLKQLLDQSSMQRLAGTVKKGKHLLTVVEMKPKDVDSEFFKVKLLVDKARLTLKELKSFSKDGSRYILSIDKVIPNPSLKKTLFTFDKTKYPGVEVEDLRI